MFTERFEAWRYGPVISSVYGAFKQYGSEWIDSFYYEQNGRAYSVDFKKNTDFKEALDYVWDKYIEYDGIKLSSITHSAGTAWYKAMEREGLYLRDEDIFEESELTE